MLTYHQWGPLTFTWGQFDTEYKANRMIKNPKFGRTKAIRKQCAYFLRCTIKAKLAVMHRHCSLSNLVKLIRKKYDRISLPVLRSGLMVAFRHRWPALQQRAFIKFHHYGELHMWYLGYHDLRPYNGISIILTYWSRGDVTLIVNIQFPKPRYTE